MTYVFIAREKPNSIGQLKKTLGHLFAVERCSIISGLMNDIDELFLDEIIIGHTQSDRYHLKAKVKKRLAELVLTNG